MKQHIYADGVANVSLAGGMVRLDMFHYSGQSGNEQQELAKSVDLQLVMQPLAFMRAYESMQRFVAELEKMGVVQRGGAPRPQEQAGSPNFE